MKSKANHQLYSLLSNEASISDGAWKYFTSCCTEQRIAAGDIFFRPGDDGKVAFIQKGLFRQYVILDDGRERNVDFCCENEFTGDINPLKDEPNESIWIQALEDSSVITFTSQALRGVVTKYPEASVVMMKFLLSYFEAKCDKEANIHYNNAKDAYLHFCENYGSFERRISLKHIASYLGISPETLSRIR